MLLLPAIAFANDWQVTIEAKGQQIDGMYKSSVVVGESSVAQSTPAAPEPPKFTCRMLTKPDWDVDLSIDRRLFCPDQCWIIALNPHGNVGNPDPRSVTLTWNPGNFGDGTYSLTEGYDCLGSSVISNMKNESQFIFHGTNKEYYFSIVKQPGLTDVIRSLSLLSGQPCGCCRVTLKEIVLMMNRMSTL